MIPARVTEVDGFLVGLGQFWPVPDETEVDRWNAVALLEVEADLRSAEFEALELVLRFTGDTPHAPQYPGAAADLWEAMAVIGWDRPAPLDESAAPGTPWHLEGGTP